MKVEKATLFFVRDDQGVRWFAVKDSDRVSARSPGDIYKWLVGNSRIKADPLKVALVEFAIARQNFYLAADVERPALTFVESIEQIIRDLAEEYTKGETK